MPEIDPAKAWQAAQESHAKYHMRIATIRASKGVPFALIVQAAFESFRVMTVFRNQAPHSPPALSVAVSQMLASMVGNVVEATGVKQPQLGEAMKLGEQVFKETLVDL